MSKLPISVHQSLFIVALLLTSAVGCSSGKSAPTTPDIDGGLDLTQSTSSQEPDSPGENLSSIISLGPVDLIVFLSGTPSDLCITVRESADSAYSEIRELSDRIKEVYRSNRGNEMSGAVQSQVRPLVQQVKYLKQQRASYVTSLLHGALDGLQDDAAGKLESIGDTTVIARDLILNTLVVETDRARIDEILALPEVEAVEEGIEPIPLTDTTAQALKLRPGAYPNVVWDQGYHGESMDVLGIDTGVYSAHSAFVGLDLQSQYFPTSAVGCNTEDQSNHGTHTCGVVASQDATYTGMAYGIETYYNAKICPGYDGYQSLQQAYQWAALGGSGSNDAEVVNLSLVFATACSQRNGLHFVSAYVDNTIDLYDVVWSLGAGNRNAGCADDQMNDKPQTCYNGVSVVGVVDQGPGLRDDDAYLTNSKYGPVYGPYNSEERLKPDIMAPTGATSPTNTGGWGGFGGTSCSAPHYSGVVAVLMSAGVTSSMEIRALTFATAEDFTTSPSSPGPDYYSGFGYVDAWAAYSHIADTFTGTLDADGDGDFYRIENVQDGDRVVLVYNKHGQTSWKISNLDLKVYDEVAGTLLYETTKTYENKEYIQFGTDDIGKDVIITSTATELAQGLSYEDYAIAANTTMTQLDEPSISVSLTSDDPVTPGEVFSVELQMSNLSDLPLENCVGTLQLDSGMEFDVGEEETKTCGTGHLDPWQFCIVTWNVIVTEYSSTKTIGAVGEGDVYGATFTDSDNISITVNEVIVNADPVVDVPDSPVDVDELFEIQATITNNESFVLSNVTATLELDTGMEFGPGEPAGKTCGTGALDPTEFCTVNWLVKVTDYTPTKNIGVHSEVTAFGVEFYGHAFESISVIEPYTPDPLAPVLKTPYSGAYYDLGSSLNFSWDPAAGTNPDAYWFDAWVDGQHFEVLPQGGLNLGTTQALLLPPLYVELNAQDGIWEWAVAAEISGQKHWSEHSIVNKFVAPTLYTPSPGAEVGINESFSWSNVPGAINYVARVTGILPGGAPFYLPLNSNQSLFVLPQPFYDELQEGVTYSWAVAGTTLGPVLTAKDQETLAKLSYSGSRTFTKAE